MSIFPTHPPLGARHWEATLGRPIMAGPSKNTNQPPRALGFSAQCELIYSTQYPSPTGSYSMNLCAPVYPQNLRIWQQNAHKSKTAQSYILNTANPNNWDVIVLQEPWFDSYGNSSGTQCWWVVYPVNFYVEGCTQVHSILLINSNPATDYFPHSLFIL